MSLPTPPPFSDPIPNPSPTVPNVPEEYIVKGPYWDMKVMTTSGLSVTSDGKLQVTGSPTVYPSAETSNLASYSGHLDIGNGIGVVEGNNLQIGTGTNTIPYYVKTAQGLLILGNGFDVNSATGTLSQD
jgi:hypothetical protein